MKKSCFILFILAVFICSACGASTGNSGGNYYDNYNDNDYYYEGESYLDIVEGGVRYTDSNPETTFSLKVDTAAYTNIKRYITDGVLPPADAVRTEELINYFSYDGDISFNRSDPFGIYTEIGPSPFDPEKMLAFIRVKTPELDKSDLPSSNFVFLIDTSGSMESHDKLPLLKEAFKMFVETLDGGDRISIVTYAGRSQVLLSGASGADKDKIIKAINKLSAGGSTAGANGIRTAYSLASDYYIKGGNNRIILASDGDFNVGISSVSELSEFISEKRETGIYLSILGFGTGNIRDDIMETLAKDGNGNYSYIDSIETSRKVLVDEIGTNLFTVADDVKAQIAFNSDSVKSYRLIGYENRTMDNKDFENDEKDAGEIGAGTDIIVMFEIELYSKAQDLFEVRIRYKDPGEAESKLAVAAVDSSKVLRSNTTDFGFACSVAMFGHMLRRSEFSEDITARLVLEKAEENLGRDAKGYRAEFITLVEEYMSLIG